jgi:hypothetical protein
LYIHLFFGIKKHYGNHAGRLTTGSCESRALHE